MKRKEKTGNFVLTVPMKTELWQEHYIDKMLRVSEVFYNELQGHMNGRYQKMIHTKEWSNQSKELKKIKDKYPKKMSKKEEKELKKEQKSIYNKRNEIIKSYGFTEFSFQKEAYNLRKQDKYKHIDSTMAYNIGKQCYSAFDKLLYHRAKKVNFKKHHTVDTISNVINNCGLRVVQEGDSWVCIWGKRFRIPLVIDEKNLYEVSAFDNPITFCRIKRIKKRNVNHYYCQIVFAGLVPSKVDKHTGEFLRQSGEGKVDITIDINRVQVVKNGETSTYLLSPNIKTIESKIKEIDLKMERSRKMNNPQNYNEKGEIIRKKHKKWHNSNRYLELRNIRRDYNRKIQIQRRISHEKLANQLISMGNDFKININYPSAEHLKKDSNCLDVATRKLQSSCAPSEFKNILERKIGYTACPCTTVDIYE